MCVEVPDWAVINVRRIPDEGLVVEGEVPEGLWNERDDGIQLAGALRVSLRCNRSGDRVQVSGRVAGKARMQCARCLEPVEVGVDAVVEGLYFPGKPPLADESVSIGDEGADEIYVGWYDPPELDLLEEVRQVAVVSLPYRALCSEDCRGLCPGCGANLNFEECTCGGGPPDPRLAKLAELRGKLKR